MREEVVQPRHAVRAARYGGRAQLDAVFPEGLELALPFVGGDLGGDVGAAGCVGTVRLVEA